MSIQYPSLPRQQEIAQILDKANALIERRREQLRELDSLAESLFYTMFGDPVTNPMGWEKKKLGELGHWQSGGTPSRKNIEYFKGDIPWVTSGELNDLYIDNSIELITNDAILNSNTKLIPVGSLLLGMYDTAALKSSITKRELTCNQAIAYSNLNNTICNIIPDTNITIPIGKRFIIGFDYFDGLVLNSNKTVYITKDENVYTLPSQVLINDSTSPLTFTYFISKGFMFMSVERGFIFIER